MVMGLYTLARFWPPVWVWLVVLSARDATFATPRSNNRRRRVLAVLPSMLARSARGSHAVVDAFDLGTPTASAGDAGAHSPLGLGGRRPSRGALWASRRNGRGVVSPKTGRMVNGVQERVGKPRVIVVQDGRGGSQAAAGWLCIGVGVGWGDVIRSRSDGWRDWSHAVQSAARREEQDSSGPGPGAASQERQAVACSKSEEGGRCCCTGSRNLEMAALSSWAGCLGRVAALLRHDRAERAAIEWHKRRRKWWGLEARRGERVQW